MRDRDPFQFKIFMSNWPNELRAGLVIFLIAMPLSIGIALASGAPATAGLLSAIVGGVLGTFLGGGHVMIDGPAAGLIVVILEAVHVLGFQKTLAAIFFSGILQIVLGTFKVGQLVGSVPLSVLHGMMASIGITIITKQIYVLFGSQPVANEEVFFQFFHIPEALTHSNWIILFVGLCCLIAVLGVMEQERKWLRWFPAPLAAIAVGIFFDKAFDLEHLHTMSFFNRTFEVGEKFLLHVPDAMFQSISVPDWSAMGSYNFWRIVVTISLISSIESLLSSYAVDRIDPLKRTSNLNRDLIAKGVCNSILGLIGGLPIITEIVRSSANVENGARTRWPNFIHGLLILGFLVLLPHYLNLIPLAAFAAILIVVGFKLAHPQNFLHAKEVGLDQLLIFVVTLVVALFTDILMAVLMGLTLKFIMHAFRSGKLKSLFLAEIQTQIVDQKLVVRWVGPAIFFQIHRLSKLLKTISDKEIVIDLRRSDLIDHTFLDFIETKKNEFLYSGQSLNILTSENHQSSSPHPQSSKVLNVGGNND